MYSGDIQGLGHVRRNTTIATRLVEEIPGARVLVFTGLPSGCFFELPRGVDFIKLPAVSKIDTGCYGPRTLTVSQAQLTRLRAAVIREVTEVFRPDLFVVDHMPTGLSGELLPTLRALKARPDPPMTVLGLRDVLDEPRVTRRLWREQGAYRAINDFYDAVLIYGCEQVFDTRFQYHLDRHLSTEVSFCGYLRPDHQLEIARPSRRELGLGEGKLVVVTAGGGADGHPMMKLCLEALHRLDRRTKLQVVCVTGPFMSRQRRNALLAQSADLPVRMLWCVDEGLPYLDAADLVITMAGYNTLMEAICLEKKIVAIPRQGPSAEQSIRSRIFSELGLIRSVSAEFPSPDQLAVLIEDSLKGDPPATTLPNMNGLATTVERMKALLAASDRPQVARPAAMQG
jgi:predicted glycosyltransferase